MTVSLETNALRAAPTQDAPGREKRLRQLSSDQMLDADTEAEAFLKEVQTAPHRFGPPLSCHSDQAGCHAKPGRYNQLPKCPDTCPSLYSPAPNHSGQTCPQHHVYRQPVRVWTAHASRPTNSARTQSLQAPCLNECTATSPRAIDRRRRHASLPTLCKR